MREHHDSQKRGKLRTWSRSSGNALMLAVFGGTCRGDYQSRWHRTRETGRGPDLVLSCPPALRSTTFLIPLLRASGPNHPPNYLACASPCMAACDLLILSLLACPSTQAGRVKSQPRLVALDMEIIFTAPVQGSVDTGMRTSMTRHRYEPRR